MHITTDLHHFSKALDQLGYIRFTFLDMRCYGGVFMPAFIHDVDDIQRIFETSNHEYDSQPVFTIHATFEDESENIELKWIGAKALLALATADQINTIVRSKMNSFVKKGVSGLNLIDEIKDVDHTFVTPDIYLDHK